VRPAKHSRWRFRKCPLHECWFNGHKIHKPVDYLHPDNRRCAIQCETMKAAVLKQVLCQLAPLDCHLRSKYRRCLEITPKKTTFIQFRINFSDIRNMADSRWNVNGYKNAACRSRTCNLRFRSPASFAFLASKIEIRAHTDTLKYTQGQGNLF